MLSIRNKSPWVLWPTRVCPSFFEISGNQVISGKYNFQLELDFSIKGTYGEKNTIFSILPIYTSLNYYNDHTSNIDVHTNDGMAWSEIKDSIFINKRHKVIVRNEANSKFEVFIDDKKVIETKNFSHVDDPQILFGAGNFPWHNENHHYCDLDLYEFKLYHDDSLISHHIFNEFIYEKSVDITNNCNFIHKI
jgi:hypothetical protein